MASSGNARRVQCTLSLDAWRGICAGCVDDQICDMVTSICIANPPPPLLPLQITRLRADLIRGIPDDKIELVLTRARLALHQKDRGCVSMGI